jgi:hypothetical protein
VAAGDGILRTSAAAATSDTSSAATHWGQADVARLVIRRPVDSTNEGSQLYGPILYLKKLMDKSRETCVTNLQC